VTTEAIPPPSESFATSGHAGSVLAVAYSPDGTTLASGSGDQTVRIWDVRSGTNLHTLTGHTDSVRAVAYSPDGTTLASGSDDQTVRIWTSAAAPTSTPSPATPARSGRWPTLPTASTAHIAYARTQVRLRCALVGHWTSWNQSIPQSCSRHSDV
jgi:WD40 repeat protein